MLRTTVFLAVESLFFTIVLLCSWFVIKRAFALLGVRLNRIALWAFPVLWALLFVVDWVFTRQLGPTFTLLYGISGWVFFTSIGLFLLCMILRPTPSTRAEKP